eukprot:scaffold63699_cov36-Prasinocladus_malaysianus.AAC.2
MHPDFCVAYRLFLDYGVLNTTSSPPTLTAGNSLSRMLTHRINDSQEQPKTSFPIHSKQALGCRALDGAEKANGLQDMRQDMP